MNRRLLLAAASAGIFLPGVAWSAVDLNEAASFVDRFAQDGIVKILEAQVSQGEKTTRFRALFKERFDIPAIARFVLARYWRVAQPAEQDQFLKVFEDVIVYTWARRFSEYNGQTLKVTGTAPDGDDGAVVNSRIVGKSEDQSFNVSWRLRKRDDGWRVVDVIVDGVSMAITYRQEYASIVAQQGGIPGLIAQLQVRAKDLGKQQGVG